MLHLLRLLSLRHIRRHRARSILTTTGIVLGVAVVVAVQILNASVLSSFAETIDEIAGRTALTIDDGTSGVGDAGTGVPEALLEEVRAVDGVATAVPVIVEDARAADLGGADIAVLGVDIRADQQVRNYDVRADQVDIPDPLVFLNREDSILLTRRFMDRHGLRMGDTIDLITVAGTRRFKIRGAMEATGPAQVFGGDLAVVDVYAAQSVFGRGTQFDRIDIVPEADTNVDSLEQRVRDRIAGRAQVRRPERRARDTERMLAGFRLGLSLCSLVALFVGVFIIYNSLAISVSGRRREIGILRALGEGRGAIVRLFLLEGLLQGTVGSVLGLLGGLALARGVLHALGATVSDLFFRIEPEVMRLTPAIAVGGLLVGLIASLLASAVPAVWGSSIDPARVLQHGADRGELALPSVRRSSWTAATFFIIGCGVVLLARIRQDYLLGYLVSGIWAIAAAFACPGIGHLLARGLRTTATRFGPTVRLGLDAFAKNAGRNAVTVAALGLALGNVVTISSFVASMKQTTEEWFERSIRADLFVFGGARVKAKFDHPLPPELGQRLAGIHGVETVNAFHFVPSRFREEPIYFLSMNYDDYLRYNRIPVVDGNLEAALPGLRQGTTVFASETFARQFDVGLGDTITLSTANGPHKLEIGLIYVDYSADVGILGFDRSAYVRIFGDSLVSAFNIHVKPGVDTSRVREHVVASLAQEYGLMVLDNGEYRKEVTAIIDRTFVITDALALVALIVAVLGIANTLLVTVMDRRREIGVLRAVGASRQQIMRVTSAEAACIAGAATLVGGLLGLAYSIYIVHEVIRYQFGWHFTYAFPTGGLLLIAVVSQAAAWAASRWPARLAANLSIVDALEAD